MLSIQHETTIDASTEAVWEATVDIEALPEHTPTITYAVRLDGGPLAPGSRVRLKQPGQRSAVWTVTHMDRPRRFVWETRSLGMRTVGIHDIEGGPTTTNRLTVELHGRMAKLAGRALRPLIARSLAKENAGIKAAAESLGFDDPGRGGSTIATSD
ncbi:MAG: SRPBCC family protein [Acidimicrobiales bacterium]|nr:SRPBCC family protein [Acidimicrobiales bacterium]